MLKANATQSDTRPSKDRANVQIDEQQYWSIGPLTISEAVFESLTLRAQSQGRSIEDEVERILESFLGPEQKKVRYSVEQAKELFKLTDREAETVELAKQGLEVKEIAERMNISQFTVKAFLRLVHLRMGCSSRKEMLDMLLPVI